MTYPKMINWSYYQGSLQDYIEMTFVNDEKTENAIKKLGFIPKLFSGSVPGIYKERINGYSPRAMSYGKIRRNYQEQYPDLEDKYKIIPLTSGTDFNSFVYTALPYLENNQVIQDKMKGIDSVNKFKFIKKELFFDEEFVTAFLNFKPVDCFGKEIKVWQDKHFPNFLKNLKLRSKEIYKELLNYDKVKELDGFLSSKNEKAKVKTLNKDFVKIDEIMFKEDECTAYWTGEVIEVTFNNNKSYNKITIEPTDEMLVIIIDENTVNENTVFWNGSWT
jgi:hypothetical protein